MSIPNPDKLRIHFVNVDHGDAVILEFPDVDQTARFAVIDTGRPELRYRERTTKYLEVLETLRGMDDYQIDFVCITHPHEDHYGGLVTLLDRFAPPGGAQENKILQFWDCGFRTTSKTYNKILNRIADDPRIVYARLAAGAEYQFGDVRIYILAPSLDLRNRFDTFGVDRNNASVVLKVSYMRSAAILAGDAQFDSWGKIAEEFPRTTKITFYKDANVERSEGPNQLNCQLLKVSHHGSKHGTSLEYLEKITPKHYMITCANATWYAANKPGWGGSWPHDLTKDAILELSDNAEIRTSHEHGNVVYELRSNGTVPLPTSIAELPDTDAFRSRLANIL